MKQHEEKRTNRLAWSRPKRYVAGRILEEHAQRIYDLSVARGVSLSSILGEAVAQYLKKTAKH